MYDVLRFWLDRGVDGFRVDVIWLMIKDDQFRDNPPNPRIEPGEPIRITRCCRSTRPTGPRCTTSSRRCARVVDDYGERVLIGEIYLPVAQLVTYYGDGRATARTCRSISSSQTPLERARRSPS